MKKTVLLTICAFIFVSGPTFAQEPVEKVYKSTETISIEKTFILGTKTAEHSGLAMIMFVHQLNLKFYVTGITYTANGRRNGCDRLWLEVKQGGIEKNVHLRPGWSYVFANGSTSGNIYFESCSDGNVELRVTGYHPVK